MANAWDQFSGHSLYYHRCSNLDAGIFEGCFIFDFALLPLEVVWSILPTMCTKVALKHQLPSSVPRIPDHISIHKVRSNHGCGILGLHPL